MNTHVIHRHPQKQQDCRSLCGAEEMHFSHSCSNKTGLIFNARQLNSAKKGKARRWAAVTAGGSTWAHGYSIPSSQISTGGAALSLLCQSHAPPCRLATVKPREKVLPLSTSNLRLRLTEGSLLCSRLSICFFLIAFCKWPHIPHVGKHVHAEPPSPRPNLSTCKCCSLCTPHQKQPKVQF